MPTKRVRRRVKTLPDQNGVWWVVTVPSNDPLAGPYDKRPDAVYVKNQIQEVLDREATTRTWIQGARGARLSIERSGAP